MALDFTFLKEDQVWGDDSLEVIKYYGTKVAPTDLTVILGGYMTGHGDRTSEGDLTCASWFASSNGYGEVYCVRCEGVRSFKETNWREVSARPALPPSEASKISPSEARTGVDGVQIAEYGEYPQTVADGRASEKLEKLYQQKSLETTGKKYTFDSVGLTDYDTSFKTTSFSEYEMDGKRYIRVPGRPADDESKLSTGEQVEEGKPYWVEVQPIEWLVDKSGWMVSKKCLFAGIQFDTKSTYDGDFSKTSLKHYLDTYFAKEIEPSQTIERIKRKETTKSVSKGGLKDFLDSKAKRLDDVSKEAYEVLKEKGLTGKALHDAAQKERLKVSKAILKQRQTTK